MSKAFLPVLRLGTTWLAFLAITSAWAGGNMKPKDFSVGVAVGPLSGAIGPAARCWWDRWGAQVTLLPAVTLYEDRSGSGDYDDGILFASGQVLYRLGAGMPAKPWSSEPGGYVFSQGYVFGGMSTLRFLDGEWDGDVMMFGGGYGLETFWRNWRMATGVGLAAAMIPDHPYMMGGSRGHQMDWAYFPTLEFTLSYGI